ncbi:MAG: DUF3656 domain-containing protein [Sphaerochaetaceae bacterium]|nr:DUF3656 domain-containing protein [Sphaerochaetaceae bacterium]
MEISLPAGNLQSALSAFKGGGDSVYLGLKDFSARKGAENFSFEDLSKLMAFSKANDKKVFVALNTLIKDNEFPLMEKILKQLNFLEVDGLIIQDLGLALFIKENFPFLELHASTQLACHTTEGVKFLRDFGFKRVVLSRELNFDEIKTIRKNVSDVELKVFIHGAMCYGFSGLCQASRLITGRSANRGECAQICRTWFTYKGKNGFFFNMKDLCLKEDILKLEEIGIEAVKIEGRMKSPLYTYSCAKYYKSVLNREPKKDLDSYYSNMILSFSRDRDSGYFDFKTEIPKDNYLINNSFTQHLGLPIGTVVKKQKNHILIKLNQPISLRDGLLIINDDITSSSAKFPVSTIVDNQGRTKSFANEGEIIQIPLQNIENYSFKENCVVYRISLHDGNLPLISETNLKPFKKAIDIEYSLGTNSLTLESSTFKKTYPLEIQEARKPSNFYSNLEKVLLESSDSYFVLKTLILKSSLYENDKIFTPISFIKNIRREFYKELDKIQEQKFEVKTPAFNIIKEGEGNLPNRKDLGLWDEIIKVNDKEYLPLNPLMFDEEKYLDSISKKVKENELIIGLNNIGQLNWALKHPEVKIFIDVFLYIANAWTCKMFKDLLPNLIGGYSWMEEKLPITKDWPFVPTYPKDFVPPAFISRTCFAKNILGQNCKTCGHKTYSIEQNNKKFSVTTKDCTTTVILDK